MHFISRLKACRSTPLALRIAWAVLLTCAAFGVRYVVLGLSTYSPFTLFFPVILVSTLMFGRGVGLVTTALAAFMALVFIEPVGSLAFPDFNEVVGVSLFIGVSVFICFIVDRLYDLCTRMVAARASAEQAQGAAEAALLAEAWARKRSEGDE
jgi:K+-sensing histidine kinase KdpD